MSIDPRALRSVLSTYATGVAVATAALPDGRRAGLTINSFTSVSLEPPLVLFCLEKRAAAFPVFSAASGFAMNILGAEQEAVSRAFATRGQGEERWQGVALRQGQQEAPLLDSALAVLECSHHVQHDGGDHVIFVGQVVNMAQREGAPLLYWHSGYRSLL